MAEPRPVDALLRGRVAVRAQGAAAHSSRGLVSRRACLAWGWCFEDGPAGGIQEGYTATPVPVRGLADVRVRAVACGTYCAAALTATAGCTRGARGRRGQPARGTRATWCGRRACAALTPRLRVGRCLRRGLPARTLTTSDGSVNANGGSDAGALAQSAAVREEHTPLPPLRRCAGGRRHTSRAATPTAPRSSRARATLVRRSTAVSATPTPPAAAAGRRTAASGGDGGAELRRPRVRRVLDGRPPRHGPPLALGRPRRCRDEPALKFISAFSLTRGAPSPPPAAALALRVLGEALPDAAELALARQRWGSSCRRAAPPSPTASSPSSARSRASWSSRRRLDADPAAVLQQLNALRGALAQAEARKEAVTNEPPISRASCSPTMLAQEILRETRGGDEPPPEPPITKGVAVVDPMTYDAMLPEEQAELQIFSVRE